VTKKKAKKKTAKRATRKKPSAISELVSLSQVFPNSEIQQLMREKLRQMMSGLPMQEMLSELIYEVFDEYSDELKAKFKPVIIKAVEKDLDKQVKKLRCVLDLDGYY